MSAKKKIPKQDGGTRQQQLPGIEATQSQREQLAIISRLPAHPLDDEFLLLPNYQPDRALREPVLAPAEDWKAEAKGLTSFLLSTQLLVNLDDQHNPLP